MKNLSVKVKHVLYDGKCGLCKKEISYYRSIAPVDKFKWVDITIDRNLACYPTINLRNALMSLHVVQNKKIKEGVDAFIAIWSELNYFKLLALFVRLPIIYQLASIFYRLFAKYRFKNLPHCQLIDK